VVGPADPAASGKLPRGWPPKELLMNYGYKLDYTAIHAHNRQAYSKFMRIFGCRE